MRTAEAGHELATDGFALRRGVVPEGRCAEIGAAIERVCGTARRPEGDDGPVGARALLSLAWEVRELATSATLAALVQPILGREAVAVRGLFLDEGVSASAGPGWHRDRTVAVRRRHALEGWGPWSTRAGVAHVRAPDGFVARMLTVRLHLDACDETTGALRVLPGTHAALDVPDGAFAGRPGAEVVVCAAARGDALLMRPLLAHAAGCSPAPGRHRVVHLEYAAGSLPTPLGWAEAARFSA